MKSNVNPMHPAAHSELATGAHPFFNHFSPISAQCAFGIHRIVKPSVTFPIHHHDKVGVIRSGNHRATAHVCGRGCSGRHVAESVEISGRVSGSRSHACHSDIILGTHPSDSEPLKSPPQSLNSGHLGSNFLSTRNTTCRSSRGCYHNLIGRHGRNGSRCTPCKNECRCNA